MKVLILLGLVAVACGRVFNEPFTGLVGYMSKYAIPLAEKIRKSEEAFRASKIVGGSPSHLGQFPYQVGLLVEFPLGTGVCGGSLVSENRVITAAHCWYDGQNQGFTLTAVLGSIELFFGGVRLTTASVALHNNWNPTFVANDVGVIYLPRSVEFNNIISPISLPRGNELSQSFAGQKAVASGFGLNTSPGSISNNQFLSHVELDVISNTLCWFSFPLYVKDSNICTSGAGGTSTCNGDSGGPLAIESQGRKILIGITSFGAAAGCSVGSPAVFARVTSFTTFFNQHI